MKKELGRIESTHLGLEDHGIMSFMIHFDFGGMVQGFGGWSLDTYDKTSKQRVGTAFGCEVINRIIEAVGCQTWERLVGNEMWVHRESDKFNARIIGIESPAYRKNAGRPFFIADVLKQFDLEKEKSE